LKFDSLEALNVMEAIMRTKCNAEFDSSIDLAIERGKFNAFDIRIENKSGFIKMLKKEFPGVHKRMMKFGRRNISLSTVAPTGTLSILSQTSSGIEPVFMLQYKRRKKVSPGDEHARIDLVDATGDAWQEYDVYHPKLKTWMELSGQDDVSKSPYRDSTAEEISWKKRLEIQAIVQKYTTHSISSTINLPSDVTVEQVSEIYFEAWKKGLKGITVYRSGSRTGVLVANEEKEAHAQVHAGPPVRPVALEADVVRFRNGEEQWIAVVGLLNDHPYEIFTGREEDSFFIPANVIKGKVKRMVLPGNKKRYDFVYTDDKGNGITVEGLSRSFNKEFWNYAKLISGVLRYGMPILNVIELVENLNLYSDNINTWKNGVVRALKKYIPEGSFALERKCPECGDPGGLFYQEGCLQCRSCGYSVCG
jgi:ribonucleoside-diphosphate reductase alpha chain